MPPIEHALSGPDTITVATRGPIQAVAPTIPFLVREANPRMCRILRLSRLLDSINLPTEESDLAALIGQSSASFHGKITNREEGAYLFVLEDIVSHDIVGTAMIIAKHGTPDSPHFYLEMAKDSDTPRRSRKCSATRI